MPSHPSILHLSIESEYDAYSPSLFIVTFSFPYIPASNPLDNRHRTYPLTMDIHAVVLDIAHCMYPGNGNTVYCII